MEEFEQQDIINAAAIKNYFNCADEEKQKHKKCL
jgi:hypothetical protein